MKKILSIILVLSTIIGLTGCFADIDDDDETSSRYELVEKVNMTVDYEDYLGYSVEIKGKLKNTTKKEFSYVSVTFAIYDADGNQIDTAMDSMNYLQSNAVWSFTAEMFGWSDVEPKSCKLVEVNAW